MAEKSLTPWWRIQWLRVYWLHIAPWLQGIVLGRLLLRYPQMKALAEDHLRLYPSLPQTMALSTQARKASGRASEEGLTYGETPWLTFVKILDQVTIGPDDVFVDLGCGSGFLCLLVAKVYQVPVLGVDLVPEFIARNQQLAELHALSQAEFRQADITTTPLGAGTLFYITCTCFDRRFMDVLAQRLRLHPPGTRIISVTRPLPGPGFAILQTLKARYSWGWDEVYIQRVI